MVRSRVLLSAVIAALAVALTGCDATGVYPGYGYGGYGGLRLALWRVLRRLRISFLWRILWRVWRYGGYGGYGFRRGGFYAAALPAAASTAAASTVAVSTAAASTAAVFITRPVDARGGAGNVADRAAASGHKRPDA